MVDWAVNEVTGTYLSGILNNPGEEERSSGQNGGRVSVVSTNGSLCERTMCVGERERRMSRNNPAPIPVRVWGGGGGGGGLSVCVCGGEIECVCVCVWERLSVCVCVCVCVWERLSVCV